MFSDKWYVNYVHTYACTYVCINSYRLTIWLTCKWSDKIGKVKSFKLIYLENILTFLNLAKMFIYRSRRSLLGSVLAY